MSTHTLTLSESQIKRIKETQGVTICKTPPYAHYQIKTSNCTITAYLSGKVVFQGEGADAYAQMLGATSTMKKSTSIHYPQCGSDEVGTGDYFGPIVVCACCIEEKDLAFLSSYSIQDSKQLADKDIVQIAPALMEHLTYSLLVLENERYNLIHQTNNMNAIKAKLHNQAFVHLQNKLSFKMKSIIVDQFTPEKNYYRYLEKEPVVIKNIHFETKAENKYLAVACASIIARYTFLEAMKQLCERYAFAFPLGAGTHVDEAGKQFVKENGFDALYKVSKFHFKNTEKIKAQE